MSFVTTVLAVCAGIALFVVGVWLLRWTLFFVIMFLITGIKQLDSIEWKFKLFRPNKPRR